MTYLLIYLFSHGLWEGLTDRRGWEEEVGGEDEKGGGEEGLVSQAPELREAC